MDFGTQPHASFIPKQPLASPTPSGYTRRNVSIVTLIAAIVFIGAVALAGGVFLYKQYLTQSLDNKKVSLERARAAFEPALIQELHRLDQRIEHSKDLLANHTAFSSFFDLLSSATLQNVQFKSLNLLTGPDGKVSIQMNGLARSYASVALQSDAFNKAKGVREPIFSALNLDSTGNVTFTINAVLDPALFKYASLVAGSNNSSTNGDTSSTTDNTSQ